MSALTVGILTASFAAFVNATSPFLLKYTLTFTNNRFPVYILTLLVILGVVVPISAVIGVATTSIDRNIIIETLKDWRYILSLVVTIVWMVSGALAFTYGTSKVSHSDVFLLMAIMSSAFILNFFIARIWFPDPIQVVGDGIISSSIWQRIWTQPPLIWVSMLFVIGGISMIAYIASEASSIRKKTA